MISAVSLWLFGSNWPSTVKSSTVCAPAHSSSAIFHERTVQQTAIYKNPLIADLLWCNLWLRCSD